MGIPSSASLSRTARLLCGAMRSPVFIYSLTFFVLHNFLSYSTISTQCFLSTHLRTGLKLILNKLLFRCFVSACTAHIRLACVMRDKDDSWILLFSFSMSSIQMVSKKYVQITITTHTESNLNVNLHASIL